MILIKDRLLEQIPQHIVNEHPMFLKFMSGYFEWLEQEGNPAWVIRNLQDLNDIDLTTDDYVQHFMDIILPQIPSTLEFDKRQFLRFINDLRSTKGSEQSYKLLFQMLFGESVELTYPKEEVLRLSDGEWARDEILIFTTAFNDVSLLDNQIVTQSIGDNLASAVVSKIQTTVSNGFYIHQINLTDVYGEFDISKGILKFGEDMFEYMYPAVTDFTITDGGTGYATNERINLPTGNYFKIERIISDNQVDLNVTAFIEKADMTVEVDTVDIGQDFDWDGTIVSLPNYTDGQNVVVHLPSIPGFIQVDERGNNDAVYSTKSLNTPIGYTTDSIPAITVTSELGSGAIIAPVTGSFVNVDGYYVDERGQLSGGSRVHDGDYYQDFSYVIKSNRNFEEYSDIVKKTIHPAGHKMFGSLDMFETINMELGNLNDISRAMFDVEVNEADQINSLGSTKAHILRNGVNHTAEEYPSEVFESVDETFRTKDHFILGTDYQLPMPTVKYNGVNSFTDYNTPGTWDGVGDGDTDYTSVVEENPSDQNYVGMFTQANTGYGIFLNSAPDLLSVVAGETVYLCVVAKNVNADITLEMYFQFTTSDNKRGRINIRTGENTWGNTGEVNTKVTDLTNGYKLIQVSCVSPVDDTVSGRAVMFTNDGVVPNLGSSIKVQSAFFGKHHEWPAYVSDITDVTYNTTNLHVDPYGDNLWAWGNDAQGTTKKVNMLNPTSKPHMIEVEQIGSSWFTLVNNYGEVIPVKKGEELYIAAIVKQHEANTQDFRFSLHCGQDNVSSSGYLFHSNDITTPISSYGGADSHRTTDLGNGFYLLEAKVIAPEDYSDMYARMTLTDGTINTGAPIGSKLYVTGFFFGKTNDWPSVINSNSNMNKRLMANKEILEYEF